MRIGLDVMGGDFAPDATIGGAILAREKFSSDDRIVLIGPQDVIKSKLLEKGSRPDLFDIVHAPDVIKMGEQPIKSIKSKPDSSIVIGYKLLKNKKIDAFASAGNSGAMLVGAIYNVYTIQGIIRPCTSTIIPIENGGLGILVDIGTNPDSKPDVMYQFAILGSTYAKYIYNIKDPKVGLLNIGEEEEKGNILSQSVHQMMKDSKDFNFIGNVEGRDLYNNKADVIVCDGFTGNILLKNMEALFSILIKRGLVDDYFKRFNYENYGGTPILGINGSVVIGHGISSAKAIQNMTLLARDIFKAGLSKKIKSALTK